MDFYGEGDVRTRASRERPAGGVRVVPPPSCGAWRQYTRARPFRSTATAQNMRQGRRRRSSAGENQGAQYFSYNNVMYNFVVWTNGVV